MTRQFRPRVPWASKEGFDGERPGGWGMPVESQGGAVGCGKIAARPGRGLQGVVGQASGTAARSLFEGASRDQAGEAQDASRRPPWMVQVCQPGATRRRGALRICCRLPSPGAGEAVSNAGLAACPGLLIAVGAKSGDPRRSGRRSSCDRCGSKVAFRRFAERMAGFLSRAAPDVVRVRAPPGIWDCSLSHGSRLRNSHTPRSIDKFIYAVGRCGRAWIRGCSRLPGSGRLGQDVTSNGIHHSKRRKASLHRAWTRESANDGHGAWPGR